MLPRRWVFRLFLFKEKSKLSRSIHGDVPARADAALDRDAGDDRHRALDEKIEKHSGKILYNTIVHGSNFAYDVAKILQLKRAVEERRGRMLRQTEETLPLSLRFLPEYRKEDEPEPEAKIEEDKRPVVLPFESRHRFFLNKMNEEREPARSVEDDRWLTDYEHFDDAAIAKRLAERRIAADEEEEEEDATPKGGFGLPDPTAPPSDVPCGGCGALLHCADTAIPGYVPALIFKNCSRRHLKAIVCQRCHFLKNYNVALNLSIAPEEYVEVLSKIKTKKALVLLMVDLLDFPNSIWPGIVDAVGAHNPIFIIGNKVDLLPPGKPNYLNHIKDCLRRAVSNTSVHSKAIIKDVALISAKTGFGVEDLVTRLLDTWRYSGDVFIVGCTNVGKSTLFNMLLQSDYCRATASDLLERATVSQWPGTTLNLLKFPILRPSDWKVKLRAGRIKRDRYALKMEEKLSKMKDRYVYENVTLLGYVGKTFINKKRLIKEREDLFEHKTGKKSLQSLNDDEVGIDEDAIQYRLSKWCHDTPGVVREEQILSILTLEELKMTMPKSIIQPRCYYMLPGKTTLLLAGLGRVDLESENVCRMVVFASNDLPVTVCRTEHADEIYSEFLGTEFLGVPIGDEERLKLWPELKSGEKFIVKGEGMDTCCADITLSSAGWVSLSGEATREYVLTPWTPNGKGINLRQPSLLPHAVHIRGKRILRTPAYNVIQTVSKYKMAEKPNEL